MKQFLLQRRPIDGGINQAVGSVDDFLLDANPLIDIRNTTKISTVILNGRVYGRETLDVMLEAAKSSTELLIPAFAP